MKLKELLKMNGFDEYPEQLMALGFAKDLLSSRISVEEIEKFINQILMEAGEYSNFDEEEKVRW